MREDKELSRREIRENIFKLLFMGNFNKGEEMDAQLKLYMENMEGVSERTELHGRQI